MRNSIQALRLSTALPALLCVMIVMTAVLMALPLSGSVNEEFTKLETLAQERHAAAIATSMERYLEDRLTLLQDYATHPRLLRAALNPDAESMNATDTMAQFSMIGSYHPLALYDFEGVLICESRTGITPKKLLDNNGNCVLTQIETGTHSKIGVHEIAGEWHWRLVAPILYMGAVEGALTALIPVGLSLEEQVRTEDPEAVNIDLTYQGVPIAHVGMGTDDITTSKQLNVPGVSIIDRVGDLGARAAKARVTRESAMIFIGVLPVLIIVWVVLSRVLIIKPVRNLQARARSIENEEDAVLLNHSYSRFAEIRDVEQTFQSMAIVVRERERSLKNLAETLEDRVRSRTEQLEAETERAEIASRAKSEFLANMSHEIRTPMTAILGYADLLAEAVPRTDTENNPLEYVQTIQRNGTHLLTIINDVLDLSKIEADKMTVESIETDPVQLVHDVLSLMRVKSAAKGIDLRAEFVTDIPKTLTSDPVRLRQILVNLVGNAIKFTEIGSVVIEVTYDDTTEQIRFAIKDTGIGLSDAQREKLFNSFAQADTSTTRKFGGTGLGLTISKRLSNMLGGDITVESEVGVGSTFSLTVNGGDTSDVERFSASQIGSVIAGERSPAVERRSSTRDNTKKKALEGIRIALFEDGPDNQRLISFHLRKAGAEVTVADNGRIGVELMTADNTLEGDLSESVPFDLILTDMQMPELDGYGATRMLRKKGMRLPIVALTAHAMDGDEKKCLDAGCDAYATKPINAPNLIATCLEMLSVDRSADKAA